MPITYEPIATTTLGSNASLTFSSIPSTYTDLRLVLNGFWTATGAADLMIQFNSDTSTNYSFTRLFGTGVSVSSSRNTSTTQIEVIESLPSTTIPGLTIIDIFSYAGSTNKTVLCQGNGDMNGSGKVARIVGLWRNTAAITSIRLESTANNLLGSGSTATLYGIKNA